MMKPDRRRVLDPPTLGQEPTDLSPEALAQWREVIANRGMFRARIAFKVGRFHADDIWQKVTVGLHHQLRNHGPKNKIIPYVTRCCMNAVTEHYGVMGRRAALYVGDDTHLLEDPEQCIHVVPTMRVELDDALKTLSSLFTERQMEGVRAVRGVRPQQQPDLQGAWRRRSNRPPSAAT